MPQVTTGYEPSGDGWQFVDERVISRAPAGTQVVGAYQDCTVLTIAGIDLWGSTTIGDFVDQMGQQGFTTYYVSRWKQPPSFLGIGLTTYRVCAVHSP